MNFVSGCSSDLGRGDEKPSGTIAPARMDAGVFMLLKSDAAAGAYCVSCAPFNAVMVCFVLESFVMGLVKDEVGVKRRVTNNAVWKSLHKLDEKLVMKGIERCDENISFFYALGNGRYFPNRTN